MRGRQSAFGGGTFAAALAVTVSAYGGTSITFDAAATRAAARADRSATISRPDSSDLSLGAQSRFAFKLVRNTGEVSVFRTHSDAENGLAKGKAIAKAFGASLGDDVYVVRNVVIGFGKTPTRAERNEVEGWLKTR